MQQSSSGAHTLGRLECTGQAAVSSSANGLPTSCTDLWWIGHSLNGFYSVMGLKKVESVYCDFTKLPTDSGRTDTGLIFLFNIITIMCLEHYEYLLIF